MVKTGRSGKAIIPALAPVPLWKGGVPQIETVTVLENETVLAIVRGIEDGMTGGGQMIDGGENGTDGTETTPAGGIGIARGRRRIPRNGISHLLELLQRRNGMRKKMTRLPKNQLRLSPKYAEPLICVR